MFVQEGFRILAPPTAGVRASKVVKVKRDLHLLESCTVPKLPTLFLHLVLTNTSWNTALQLKWVDNTRTGGSEEMAFTDQWDVRRWGFGGGCCITNGHENCPAQSSATNYWWEECWRGETLNVPWETCDRMQERTWLLRPGPKYDENKLSLKDPAGLFVTSLFNHLFHLRVVKQPPPAPLRKSRRCFTSHNPTRQICHNL